MDDPLPRICPACGDMVAAAANFCGRCGRSLNPSAASSQPAQGRWYHNLWFVLLMIFFVLGPFALPLVWKNPRLSRNMKLLLTVLTVLYTVWIVSATIDMTKAVMDHVEQFNKTLQF